MSVLVTQRCPVLLSVHETSWHDQCLYHWPQLPPKWQPHAECYCEWSQVCSNADLSPVIWLSQTNTMAWIIQRCCVIGRCVSLPGNIPCTTLSISPDIVNDYSRHKKSCCHTCSAKMVLSCGPTHLVPLHRWCLRSDQGASASCVHSNSSSTSHKNSSVSKGRRANSSSCNYLSKLIPLQFQSAALDIPSSGCNAPS